MLTQGRSLVTNFLFVSVVTLLCNQHCQAQFFRRMFDDSPSQKKSDDPSTTAKSNNRPASDPRTQAAQAQSKAQAQIQSKALAQNNGINRQSSQRTDPRNQSSAQNIGAGKSTTPSANSKPGVAQTQRPLTTSQAQRTRPPQTQPSNNPSNSGSRARQTPQLPSSAIGGNPSPAPKLPNPVEAYFGTPETPAKTNPFKNSPVAQPKLNESESLIGQITLGNSPGSIGPGPDNSMEAKVASESTVMTQLVIRLT